MAPAPNAVANVAPHQQPAILIHIVAERQLGQIVAVECDQHAPQKSADPNSPAAFIRREIIALPCG